MFDFVKLLSLVFVTVGLAASPKPAAADWNCVCGATVHVNYPTTCPVCSRSLPNSPSPTPPYTPPYTPPGAPDSSGVTLGVNIYNAGPRVIVQSVLPNTPAQGRLFPNDQLVKGAFRDVQTGQVHRVQIYSPADLTRLKTMAGAGQRVALQVLRPTSGPRNFFVNFAPPGGIVTRTYQVTRDGQAETRTSATTQSTTITEDTSGAAAAMLDAGSTFNSGGGVSGGGSPVINGGVGGGGESAADLLGGN